QHFFRGKIEADAALGVPRSVQNVRRQAACPQPVAIPNTRFDSNLTRCSHTYPCSLHVQHFQQRVVILIQQDRRASRGAQLHGSAHVIDVGVGDDDLLHDQFVLADDGKNVFNVVARIDDHGFVRGLIADDGTVTLQRADRKDLVNHALQLSQKEKSEVKSQIEEVKAPLFQLVRWDLNVPLLQSYFCLLTCPYEATAICPVV